MSNSLSQKLPLEIPVRLSSRAALKEQTVRITSSRAELKRKLSDSSLAEGSVHCVKLRIADTEAEKEEQELHKTWLDLEEADRNLNDEEYRSAQRDTYRRIISLGSDLWKLNRTLREHEEKEGKVPVLSPDTEGAFIATLLALYKDPMTSNKRSSTNQTNMRRAAIQAYRSDLQAPEGKLWCPISKGFFDSADMKAAHIVPASLGPEVVDYLFGHGSGSRLSSADNCLIIHRTVERSFNDGNFVLLPINANDLPIQRWRICLTNSSAMSRDIGRTSLAVRNGSEVEFRTSFRPAARFLYYHFVVTLLRNKKYCQPGWEKIWMDLRTGHPWPTPGRYLRKSILLTLARYADDVEESEVEKLFAGDLLFEEHGHLDEKEENEVARRVLVARGHYEVEDDEEEDDEEEDDEEATDD
ncbi:hypothetical protein MMC24_006374 [Lignoscripta atroalba]|nr:hypothetical protein [Lignoscripta atroalba]